MRRVEKDGEVKLISAIEVALEANQIRALNLIIEFIIEYQNQVAYSNLFQDVFI